MIVSARLSAVGKIFIAVLLVTIFEGAFRKWVSSSLTNPLVLFRDFLALWGIYLAIKIGGINFNKVGSKILLYWTVVFVLWGLFQLMVNQNSPLVFIIGARFWLLYLWFGCASAASLTRYDFVVISKTILLILFLMTPLVVMQHFLPPFVFINKQVDGDDSTVFVVAEDVVRTTGTFSFTLGYTVFIAFATPFVFALLSSRTKLHAGKWLPIFGVLMLGIATMLSGSRGSIVFLGLIFLAYAFISSIYTKGSSKLAALTMIATVIALLALIPIVFDRAFDATQQRFDSASQVEDVDTRLLTMFLGEQEVYENLSVIGKGLGSSNNFAAALITGSRAFLLAETETARIMLEGGIVGILFLLLKMLLVLIGLFKSWRIVRSTGNSLPLMLWITTSLALLSWSIVGQLTVNALGYLLFGLAVASLRIFRKTV